MIDLNLTDPRPLYEQITEKMKDLIIGGYLKQEDKMPSVRELAAQLAINPNTIQKAYKQLESEGYIYARPAKGYFVKMPDSKEDKFPPLVEHISDLIRELYFLGYPKEKLYEIIDLYYK
ncbi:MAG: GntR family transcriptional regulator [Clostridia bacterium]|nr:GntR family transcriptional regulator [Clostridia bacterium]